MRLKENIRTFFCNKLGVAGLILILLFVFMAIFAPVLAPYDPFERVGEPFESPSLEHLLGTNDLGNDILSELIYGSRISITVGIMAATIAMLIGSFIGLLAGYFGGKLDAILMRVVDIALVMPMLPLMILMATFLGPSFWNIIIVIGALSWARPARVIRAQVKTIKSRGYIEAVNVVGGKSSYIIFHHILPSTMSSVISQLILVSSRSILMETSLSFLGLGDPTQKSWGTVLYYAQAKSAFLTDAWLWWILPPGILITVLVISFSYIGNALEEIANPRLRR